MANQPQSLSKGQREETTRILRREVIGWTLTGLALLGGIMGISLWQIKQRVERKMEALVAKQFEEPRIRQVVQDVAATRAASIIERQVQPEVHRFKNEISGRLADLDRLVAQTQQLEKKSQEHEQAMQAVLSSLQKALTDGQQARDRIVGLESDVVKMQKCVAKIQYYHLKGRNTFPNPFQKEMVDALNEMMSIALPNPQDRAVFIKEMGGPQL